MERLRWIDDELRRWRPAVLGALLRRHRDLERCEDAVQEACVVAVERWTRDGLPERPDAWLLTVANRRVIDSVRADAARSRREARVLIAEPLHPNHDGSDLAAFSPADDTLELMEMCAHPALSPESQMALTLRSVGGLTTAEIAAAMLVPVATMTRRLSRARSTISSVLESGERLRASGERAGDRGGDALSTVRRVLYLIFNEGYAASTGLEHQR
ncbi:MAG: sigma-70 family RNA polymerase sigma factor, partial [Actinobacteria bacterium]|nr:sigma-70 family RNA polymerase sigma factor [Actinomycetota bacterium]